VPLLLQSLADVVGGLGFILDDETTHLPAPQRTSQKQ
jgi:hypothetical protein